MFERYTEAARRLLFFSRYEASQFGSPIIDTEHVLLGLIRADKGIAGRVLADGGVTLEQLRADIDRLRTGGDIISTAVEMPFSDATRRVLHFAEDEANLLKHASIGTEHMLLALVRADDTAAGSILARRGVTLDDARRRVQAQLAAVTVSVPPTTSRAELLALVERIRALLEEFRVAAGGRINGANILDRIDVELDTLRGRISS